MNRSDERNTGGIFEQLRENGDEFLESPLIQLGAGVKMEEGVATRICEEVIGEATMEVKQSVP